MGRLRRGILELHKLNGGCRRNAFTTVKQTAIDGGVSVFTHCRTANAFDVQIDAFEFLSSQI